MDFKGTRYDIDQFQELQNDCRVDALKKLEGVASKVRPRRIASCRCEGRV